VHLQPAYRNQRFSSEDLSETELAAREILSLPIYPEIKEADIEKIIKVVKTFLERIS
jgi:dTDP-4-amino-4,6-dideoxygalactose transaminase